MDLSLSEAGVEGRMALRDARGSILPWGLDGVLVASLGNIRIILLALSTGHCVVITSNRKTDLVTDAGRD